MILPLWRVIKDGQHEYVSIEIDFEMNLEGGGYTFYSEFNIFLRGIMILHIFDNKTCDLVRR